MVEKIFKKYKGVIFGIAYGLTARAIFALEDFRKPNPVFSTMGLMTLSFMFVVPFVIGLLVAYFNDTITSGRKVVSITSIYAVLGLTIFSVLAGYEGSICALMALPVFIVMAFIGGFIGVRIFKRNKNKLYISTFLLLPFIIAPIENKFPLKDKIFKEYTQIEINSNPTQVWNNITRVRAIQKKENNYSLFQFMGFPRPMEAILDTVAVGGIRKAIFARGLFFTETVTYVEPYKILAFDIKADPNSIPPTALDEHVTVGGKYFDVLEGKYEIQEISSNKIILHLTSQFRLSTPFNFIVGFGAKSS